MKKVLLYFLCYLLWVVTGTLGFLNLIAARRLYLVILAAFSLNRWAVPALDKLGFLFLGITWLVLVIFSEYYYRNSISKNRLWKSFSLITGIQLLFLFLAWLIPLLIFRVERLSGISYLLAGSELSGGITLLIVALHYSSHNFTSVFTNRRERN